MSEEERQLVRRCLRGDSQAIAALVQRFQPEVYGLCVRLLHHCQDAEDVTQEVFLRVFRSLQRWDPERPLRPWILGIAVNRCRTWLSQRARQPQAMDYLHETVTAPPADECQELLQEIQVGVARLRADYRTVFVLYHEQGLSYEEIAAALGRPIGTVKTWLHRARWELLEHLRQRGLVPRGET